MTDASFRREQRRVIAGIAAVGLVVALLLAASHALRPIAVPPLPGFAERIAYALRLEVFVVFWLALAIANVARLRFFSAQDIAGSGLTEASPKLRQARAILQNTLEQAVLAMAAHLALAAQPGQAWMPLLPVMVLLFGLGRLLFWIGYRHGAAGRAIGFGLTFYPSMFCLFLAIILALG